MLEKPQDSLFGLRSQGGEIDHAHHARPAHAVYRGRKPASEAKLLGVPAGFTHRDAKHALAPSSDRHCPEMTMTDFDSDEGGAHPDHLRQLICGQGRTTPSQVFQTSTAPKVLNGRTATATQVQPAFS